MGAGQLVSLHGLIFSVPDSNCCLSLEGLPFPNEEFDFVCVGYSSVIVSVNFNRENRKDTSNA